MCGRCIIFTYDEVLQIVRKIEVGAPLNAEPDWPARKPEAYPKSSVPLIIPQFDTAIGPRAVAGMPGVEGVGAGAGDAFAAGIAASAAPANGAAAKGTFAPGSLAVCDLSWGFEESWKPGVVFNTRIESAAKPTWRESMEHRRCILPVPAFFETHRDETYPSPKTGRPIKRQYEFRVPGHDIILIGCTWRAGSFSMVTTEANKAMAPIHHRMPLIVRQEELPLWFGPDYRQLADRSAIPLEARAVLR